MPWHSGVSANTSHSESWLWRSWDPAWKTNTFPQGRVTDKIQNAFLRPKINLYDVEHLVRKLPPAGFSSKYMCFMKAARFSFEVDEISVQMQKSASVWYSQNTKFYSIWHTGLFFFPCFSPLNGCLKGFIFKLLGNRIHLLTWNALQNDIVFNFCKNCTCSVSNLKRSKNGRISR